MVIIMVINMVINVIKSMRGLLSIDRVRSIDRYSSY